MMKTIDNKTTDQPMAYIHTGSTYLYPFKVIVDKVHNSIDSKIMGQNHHNAIHILNTLLPRINSKSARILLLPIIENNYYKLL